MPQFFGDCSRPSPHNYRMTHLGFSLCVLDIFVRLLFCEQYYIDLPVDPHPFVDERKSSQDDDGYLRISTTASATASTNSTTTSTAQYFRNPLSSQPPPLAEQEELFDASGSDFTSHSVDHPYSEKQPLLSIGNDAVKAGDNNSARLPRPTSIPDEIAPGFEQGLLPSGIHTLPEVHRRDDSDSGHSSSYAPGSWPGNNADDLPMKVNGTVSADKAAVGLGAIGGRCADSEPLLSAMDGDGGVLRDSVFGEEFQLNVFQAEGRRTAANVGSTHTMV